MKHLYRDHRIIVESSRATTAGWTVTISAHRDSIPLIDNSLRAENRRRGTMFDFTGRATLSGLLAGV